MWLDISLEELFSTISEEGYQSFSIQIELSKFDYK